VKISDYCSGSGASSKYANGGLKLSVLPDKNQLHGMLKACTFERSGRCTKLNLKSALTAFFALYVIALSFIPLVHNMLLGQDEWIGYDDGAYVFHSPQYFVLFNEPYDGSSKPQIYLSPAFAPAAQISLIEFSDSASWIGEHNLFNEFNVTVRTTPGALVVTYSRSEIVIQKTVEVTADGIKVTLESDTEFTTHIELYRWVMKSVNGIQIDDTPRPLDIAPAKLIGFEFEDQTLQSMGRGAIVLSSLPAGVKIWPHGNGFNKISIDFTNRKMEFTVSGSMEMRGAPSAAWSPVYIPYVLPVVAISTVALYLLVDKHGRTRTNHASCHRR
jgi:hypothetical protein